MADVIAKLDRPIVLSLCEWGLVRHLPSHTPVCHAKSDSCLLGSSVAVSSATQYH
jgi:hypothetical protein